MDVETLDRVESYTTEDMQRILHIKTRQTIATMAKDGKLPGIFRVGNRWLFSKPVVDEWIESMAK